MTLEAVTGDRRITPIKQLVEGRIADLGLRPSEKKGQNFIIDQKAIDRLAGTVIPGNVVIEVGPGIGHVTEALAQNAHRLIALEIDPRFEPALVGVRQRNPNVQVLYGDAIAQDFRLFMPDDLDNRGAQVVANIPFHITEPLITKLKDLPLDDATLMVGKRFAEEVTAPDEESDGFGKLTLLTQTYFDIEVLQTVPGEDFLPKAGTDAAIVRFTPKEKAAYSASLRTFILKRLFDKQRKNPSVKSVIKDALAAYDPNANASDKTSRNRRTRRAAKFELKDMRDIYNTRARSGIEDGDYSRPRRPQRDLLEDIQLPIDILNKTFNKLDRSDLRILSSALRTLEHGPQIHPVFTAANA